MIFSQPHGYAAETPGADLRRQRSWRAVVLDRECRSDPKSERLHFARNDFIATGSDAAIKMTVWYIFTEKARHSERSEETQ